MVCDFRLFSRLALENIVPGSFQSPGDDYLLNSFLVAIYPIHGKVMIRILDMLQGDFRLLS